MEYVNAGDVASRQRSNHTGTQPASTISDFVAVVGDVVDDQKGIAGELATLDLDGKIPAEERGSSLVASVNGHTGAVTITKADVGLSAVDNTADASKPVSTAQGMAIAAKYTKPSGGIPATDLDSGVQTNLDAGASAVQRVNGHSGGNVTVAKFDLDLANVDNTSDADKPVSGPVQEPIDALESMAGSPAGFRSLGVATPHNMSWLRAGPPPPGRFRSWPTLASAGGMREGPAEACGNAFQRRGACQSAKRACAVRSSVISW